MCRLVSLTERFMSAYGGGKGRGDRTRKLCQCFSDTPRDRQPSGNKRLVNLLERERADSSAILFSPFEVSLAKRLEKT